MVNNQPPLPEGQKPFQKTFHRHLDLSSEDIAREDYDAMEGVDWEFTVHNYGAVVAQRNAARKAALEKEQ